MRAHWASSITQSSNAAPKPSTCVFIGSRTASPKTNTSSIGAKAATTSPTTSPSVIPRLTIASCACRIWLTYTDQLLCKGVLNLSRYHFRVTLRSSDPDHRQAVSPSSHLHQRSHTTTKTTTICQRILQQLSVVFPLLTHKLSSSCLGLTSFHQYLIPLCKIAFRSGAGMWLPLPSLPSLFIV